MRRAITALWLVGAGLLVVACATEGTGSTAVYGSLWYDDPWYGYGYGYGGGCCIDYPGDVGPPHPEHPIALPPGQGGAAPSNPIATPPKAEAKPSTPSSSRPMPSPLAAW